MASEISLSRPQTALTQLREIALPSDAPRDSTVQLIITVDNSAVNVRELSAYLSFIDRTYGRLTQGTLTRYSRQRGSQLETSFRQGSLEIVLSELLAHYDSVTTLVVIRYLLKYLPTFLTSSATAYRDYEEAAMVRERRKQLRAEIKQDEELATLNKDKQNEIIAFLNALYSLERRRLPAAKRFAAKYVRKIILKIAPEDESSK